MTIQLRSGNTYGPATPGAQPDDFQQGREPVAPAHATTPPDEGILSGLPKSRPSAPFEQLPRELLNKILEEVPNGHGNRVRSLMWTSKALFSAGFEKTREKAKASDLIDRANRIGNLEPSTNVAEVCKARLTEFRTIAELAIDTTIPLRGKNLSDVFVALAKNIDALHFCKDEGLDLMIGLMEGLGRDWNQVHTRDPEARREQQSQIDDTKCTLLDHLCNHFDAGGIDDPERPAYFEKLYSILESIGSPGAKNRAFSTMSLGQWYNWHADKIGAERFRMLINLVEINLDDLSDSTKTGAIANLAPKLACHELAVDVEIDFGKLTNIALSIEGDTHKSNAAIYLIERLNWLTEGEARIFARARLDQIVSTIGDDAARGRAEAAEPDPNSP